MSRKYFGTDGVRGLANTFPMTPDLALKLGAAAGRYFRKDKKQHRVVIGKDTRRRRVLHPQGWMCIYWALFQHLRLGF